MREGFPVTQAGLDYIKSVKRRLVGNKRQKKAYLNKLTADVADRLEEEPALDETALADIFGKPEELAQDFMETLDAKEIKKAFTWKKVVLIGVIAALLIWLGVAIAAIIDAHIDNHGYSVEYMGDDSSTTVITVEYY